MASEALPRFTAEALRNAAKQSKGCHVVPVRLRRAIKRYLREQEEPHMKRKVLSLSQSFSDIKEMNLLLPTSTSKELVEDPLKSMESSKRWKITSGYGDTGLTYTNEQTIAYVASRMPAVYSACFRILSEVRRRLPGFSPASVLDFGAGTGSAFWAIREVWPRSLERVNLIEPSQSMQRAGQQLIKDQKNLPIIQSYTSIQALAQKLNKSERKHNLVIASYVLGEIPSYKDRITVVRQLWDLTKDVLILVEPGTPQGSSIISRMRSHILWMENRRSRKAEVALNKTSKDLITLKSGAFVLAPCPHDGVCPLENTKKYCHFVQRLERTTSQRAYKRSKGEPLRGFEDEKFCYVAFKRGERSREDWPLEGMKFETLKEQIAARISGEDIEIDENDDDEELELEVNSNELEIVKREGVIKSKYEEDETNEEEEEEEEEEKRDEVESADTGSGWGRIIYSPVRRGKRVEIDVCRSIDKHGKQGSFDRIVVTKSKNPTLHHQARRSLWGDLWPF